MFNSIKADDTVTPLYLSAVRAIHLLLCCYAAAIIWITFTFPGYVSTADRTGNILYYERVFAFFVAVPILVGSLLCLCAVTLRRLFVPAIFFATLLSLSLMALPLMSTIYFPSYLAEFILAALYIFSAIILTRFWLSLPVPAKK